MKNIFILLILLFTTIPYYVSGAEEVHTIKFGIDANNTPPLLYQFDNANVSIATGGFLYEISVAIAEELLEDYSILAIPKKQISQEIISGELDLLCHNSNLLDYVQKDEIELSIPLYKSIQCALSKKSSVSLKQLNEIIKRLNKKKVFKEINERYSNRKTMPKPLFYGLNDTNSPPFLLFDNSTKLPTLRGGLYFDIALEIGKKIKRPLNFRLFPRKRLDSELADGKNIELVCYGTEAWAGEYSDKYLWSVPIFKQSDLIVSIKKKKGNVTFHSLDDLLGKRIGTGLGFVYPSLIPYFKNDQIIREDALSGTANLGKLTLGRIPFIIMNNLQYNYYKKNYPNLQSAPFELDPIDVKCAVSKHSNLKINELNSAILDLKKSGKLQKIFFPR